MRFIVEIVGVDPHPLFDAVDALLEPLHRLAVIFLHRKPPRPVFSAHLSIIYRLSYRFSPRRARRENPAALRPAVLRRFSVGAAGMTGINRHPAEGIFVFIRFSLPHDIIIPYIFL